MRIFTKQYHPPGTSPGTLAPMQTDLPLSIRLLDYTDQELRELDVADLSQCRPFLERDSTTWIHCRGNIPSETLRGLGELFGLHPLALEDVVNTGQRAKLEEYEQQIFIVMHLPVPDDGGGIHAEQISLFVGEGFMLSFQTGAHDPFEPLRDRLRRHIGRIRSQRSDYLLYALLDVIVDEGFPVLEAYGEIIESLEDDLLTTPDKDTLDRIHQLRRELLLLRRMLWPEREVLNLLLREVCPCIQPDTRLYLRDCYDHTVQILDLLESYREMASSMLDVYLSSASNRLNESMRLLTIIATLFIPLTFIAGVYGMNFGNPDNPWAMPELRWTYGYPAVWLLMIAVAGLMLWLFRRNKWL